MRILLIEDDASIAQFIKQGLTEAGFTIDHVCDGESGLACVLTVDYEAIVLDIILPTIDGLRVLQRIREHRVKTPTLLLTARDSIEDRVRGLNLGADDYLVKPFAFPELLARLRALLRRPPLQLDTRLQVGDLTMDTLKREVRRAGRLIDLSPREYTLLHYFMRHAGQVLTRAQIAEHIWNFDFVSESNVVDVYIGYLRRKIDRGAPTPLFHTVRGVGFRLNEEHEHG